MKFLSRFFGYLKRPSSARGADRFALPVLAEEPLARFVVRAEHLYAESGLPKAVVYLPDRNGRTSVFRVDGLQPRQVRSLGAANLGERSPVAHAVTRASAVLTIGLRIDPNNIPDRHADIFGWPETKEERKQLALRISEAASVVRYEAPAPLSK